MIRITETVINNSFVNGFTVLFVTFYLFVCLCCAFGIVSTADAEKRRQFGEESRRVENEVNDRMMKGFEEACGSCLCREILGCDISTPEGKQYARQNNLFKERCPRMVAVAVDVLEEIIGERQ